MALFSRIWGRRPSRPPRGGRPGDVLARQPHLGHGGIAIGSLREPDYSAENVAQWRQVGAAEVDEFLYGGQPLFVHSTNVAAAIYHHDDEKMTVEYLNGSAYLYSHISEGEALDFARAQSKGGWCWDYLRVRGSATKHRKPYVKLRGGSVGGRKKHLQLIARHAPKPGQPVAPGA